MKLLYIGIAVLVIIGAFFILVRTGGNEELTGEVVKETAAEMANGAAEKVTELLSENERLEERVAELKATLDERQSDFKEVVGLRKALDDVYDDKAVCENDLAEVERELEAAQARNRVLEKWVAACEAEFGSFE